MATDTRQGLNASFSYAKDGKRELFRFRCAQITKGYEVVASEEEARNRRAMYPHAVSPTQFSVVPLLKGWSERETFNDWMREYAEFAITPDPATNIVMTVLCPARNFIGVGVYTSGLEYGDDVGSMVWQPQVVFASAYDPNEKKSKVSASYIDLGDTSIFNRSAAYFYPASDAGTLAVGATGVDLTPVLDPAPAAYTAYPKAN